MDCRGSAAPRTNAAPTAPASNVASKKKMPPSKPTWEQCFNMSIERGFNHQLDEWQQSIVDCQEGKIPLN
jgi:hypothetical protein